MAWQCVLDESAGADAVNACGTTARDVGLIYARRVGLPSSHLGICRAG